MLAAEAAAVGADSREPGDVLRRRLTRIAAAAFVVRVSAVALNFLVNLGMARLLGAEGYGVFALVLAWSLVLSIPAGLGFDRLVTRELARMQVRPDPPSARSMLRVATVAVTAISVVAGALVLAAALFFGDGRLEGSFGAIAVGAVIVPLVTLTALHQGALLGVHRIIRGQLPDSIVRPGVLLALVAGALLVASTRPPTVTGPLLLAAASACGLVASIVLWRLAARSATGARLITGDGTGVSPHRPVDWVRAALPLASLISVSIVSNQVDLVLVGLLLDPESAGVYAIAVRASVLAAFPLTVLNAALAPTYATLIAAGELERLQRIVTTVARGATLVTVVLAAALLLYGSSVLGLFGAEFRSGAPALSILVLGQVVNAVFGPNATLMLMGGFERRAALTIGMGVVVQVVLVLLLVGPLGLQGAAIGSTAGIVAWNVLMAVYLRRRLGIRTTPFGL